MEGRSRRSDLYWVRFLPLAWNDAESIVVQANGQRESQNRANLILGYASAIDEKYRSRNCRRVPQRNQGGVVLIVAGERSLL
jgi:hypothetical protein